MEDIERLKAERGGGVLAHNYIDPDYHGVADARSSSKALAAAESLDSDRVISCRRNTGVGRRRPRPARKPTMWEGSCRGGWSGGLVSVYFGLHVVRYGLLIRCPGRRSAFPSWGNRVVGRRVQWCLQIYPRLCGGADFNPGWLFVLLGLSPPVRGSPGRGVGRVGERRSIPARAGEPPRSALSMAIEDVALLAIENVTLRGLTCGGSGATGAAEPGPNGSAGSPKVVYPRPCGGAGDSVQEPCKPEGLSPPVRGSPVATK